MKTYKFKNKFSCLDLSHLNHTKSHDDDVREVLHNYVLMIEFVDEVMITMSTMVKFMIRTQIYDDEHDYEEINNDK